MDIHKNTIKDIAIFVALLMAGYWSLENIEKIYSAFIFILDLFMPFIVGFAIAFILNVPMRRIESRLKKKMKYGARLLSLVITLFVMSLVLSLIGILLIPQISLTISKITSSMPEFSSDISSFLDLLSSDFPFLAPVLDELNAVTFTSIASGAISFISDGYAEIIGNTFSAAGGIIGGIFDAIFSIIFCIYILFGQEQLRKQSKMLLYAFCSNAKADYALKLLRRTEKTFSNFLTGQCLEAIILGLLFAVAMVVFQMPYISLICVMISFTALVPLVGAFVGCGIGAILIAVDNPIQAIWFCVLFIVIQQIEGNVIYPKVVGSSVGLPSMWVLVAVSVGGGIAGVIGILIMIPLSSVLYSLLCELTYKKILDKNIDSSKYI